MTTMMLEDAIAIDRHARWHLIRDVYARSPLFREAAVSGPVLTRDGEVGLDVSFDGGPTLFRVVAESEDSAYAVLHELALAMLDVDQRHRTRAGGGGEEMKRNVNRMRIGVVFCCLVAIFLAGCATARGVGQDTQSLGRSIEKKAQ